ncbi:MAG: fimbrillin family protein [Bacteroidales bacterium]|nr:fimbrillin family protein [Bacteroidales bacterium]
MPETELAFPGCVELQVSGGVSTRSTDSGWDADVIGIRTVSVSEGSTSTMVADYANVAYATEKVGSGGAQFEAVNAEDRIIFDDSQATVTFTAYGPYTEADDGLISSLPGKGGVITVDTRHQYTEDDYHPGNDPAQEAINYIWAPAVSADEFNPEVDFVFSHCMAKLKLVIYPGAGTDVDEEEHLPYYLHGLVHDGTFDVTTGKATATGEPEDTEIYYNFPFEVDKNEDDEHKDVVYTILVLPQKIESLTISTDVDGENLVGEFSLPTYTDPDTGEQVTGFEAGKSYTYTTYVRPRELQTEKGSTIADWIDPDTGEASEAYNDNLWDGHKIGIAVVSYDLDASEEDTAAAEQLYTSFMNVAYQTDAVGEAAANFHVVDYLDAIWYRNEGDELTMRAYGPYQESGDKSLLPGNDGKVTADCAELSAAYGSEAANFIFAGETTSVYNEEDHTHFVDFDFTHSMAKIVLTYLYEERFGFGIGGLATEGVFDVTTGVACASGEAVEWTLEDKNGDAYADRSEYTDPETQLDARDFILYVFPQTATIEILITPSRGSGTAYIRANNEQTYEAGYVYHYTYNNWKGMLTGGETYSPY